LYKLMLLMLHSAANKWHYNFKYFKPTNSNLQKWNFYRSEDILGPKQQLQSIQQLSIHKHKRSYNSCLTDDMTFDRY